MTDTLAKAREVILKQGEAVANARKLLDYQHKRIEELEAALATARETALREAMAVCERVESENRQRELWHENRGDANRSNDYALKRETANELRQRIESLIAEKQE